MNIHHSHWRKFHEMKLKTGEISILFPVKLIKFLTDCAVIWDREEIGEWSTAEDEKENEQKYLISSQDSNIDRCFAWVSVIYFG